MITTISGRIERATLDGRAYRDPTTGESMGVEEAARRARTEARLRRDRSKIPKRDHYRKLFTPSRG